MNADAAPTQCPAGIRFRFLPDGRCITAVAKSCFAALEDCISAGKDGSEMQVWEAGFHEPAGGYIMESAAKRSEPRCYDDRPTRCRQWAAKGECANNEGYMRVTCRKSCGVCVESPGCSAWSSAALEAVRLAASGLPLRAPVLRLVPRADGKGRTAALAVNITAWASAQSFPGHYHLSHQKPSAPAAATVSLGGGGSAQAVASGPGGALCLAGALASLGSRAGELQYAVWAACDSDELRGLPFQVWRAECVEPPPPPPPPPPSPAPAGPQRVVAFSSGASAGGTTVGASVSVSVGTAGGGGGGGDEGDGDDDDEPAAAAAAVGGAVPAAWPQRERTARAAPAESAISRRAARLEALMAGGDVAAGGAALARMAPWELLGVAQDAAPDEVRSHFRALSRHFHPDKGAGEATLTIFRALQRAAHEMRDPAVSAASAARFEERRAFFSSPHVAELDAAGAASAHAGARVSLLVFFDPRERRGLALRPLVVLAAEALAAAALRVGAVRCAPGAETDALCREQRLARLPAFVAVGAGGFRRELAAPADGRAGGETDLRLPQLLLEGALEAQAELERARAAHDEL